MYLQLEKDLIDFFDYVPLDAKHLEVYSPKLVALILQIGPEVISGFDIAVGNQNRYAKMAEIIEGGDLPSDLEALWRDEAELKAKNKSLSFKRYSDFLEKHCYAKLSKASVGVKESSYVVFPFTTQPPEWWDVHNSLKHDKYTNLKNATLKMALVSLGALFWIQSLNMSEIYIENKSESQLFIKRQA